MTLNPRQRGELHRVAFLFLTPIFIISTSIYLILNHIVQ